MGPQGDPLILVAHASSREMNPTLRQADIDCEMGRDPAAGLAEYYAEFRTDISAFVSQEVIDAASAIASMIWILQPISVRRFATSPAYLRPASSASGQILTERSAKGDQSVFPKAPAPPEDVVATTPLFA